MIACSEKKNSNSSVLESFSIFWAILTRYTTYAECKTRGANNSKKIFVTFFKKILKILEKISKISKKSQKSQISLKKSQKSQKS